MKNILSAVRGHSFIDGRLRSDAKLFIRQTERLLEAVNEVESSKPGRLNVALKNLIVTAYSLHRGRREVNIEAILDDLTPKELNPCDTEWLKGFIKKLARYRECCGYLMRVSKKHVLLKNATVVAVSLGQECFTREGESPGEQCLANCISRCQEEADGYERSIELARVAALRELGNGRFLTVLQKIIKESRIHAEVQIVAYYELHPPTIQPRIIRSSKAACYLCNLFIKEHGKFHTPRTHGTLYTGWRLPNLEKLNPFQIKLNKSLQARIWDGSLEYMKTKRTKVLISVNESDVGSLSSMSSLGSFGLLTGKADVVENITTGVKVESANAILSPKGKPAPSTSSRPLAKIGRPDRKEDKSQTPTSRREGSQAKVVQFSLGDTVRGGPEIEPKVESEPAIEQTPTVSEESPQEGEPLVSEPGSKSNRLIAQISPPSSPEPTPKSEETRDEDQIFLTQGQVSTFHLDSHRKSPSYHTGKFIIHPEFITSPATTSSLSPSTSQGEESVELRITWLLPSQPDQAPSQYQPQDVGDTRNGNLETKSSPLPSHSTSKKIPEFLVESLSTSEDTDTGSCEFVRLVNRGGDTVLIEVVRS